MTAASTYYVVTWRFILDGWHAALSNVLLAEAEAFVAERMAAGKSIGDQMVLTANEYADAIRTGSQNGYLGFVA